MPFSFPSNPTTGQYSRQNNRVYKWNGYSWDLFYNNLSVPAGTGPVDAWGATVDASKWN